MSEKTVIVERIFNAPRAHLWKALTERDLMKQWYFDLAEFEPKVGFKFEFFGGHEEGIQYKHLCEITEVIPDEKLTYSWAYEGYQGKTYVTFELFDEQGNTRLKLTHKGFETFPADNPDFALGNFEEGWNEILNQSLKSFIDNHSF